MDGSRSFEVGESIIPDWLVPSPTNNFDNLIGIFLSPFIYFSTLQIRKSSRPALKIRKSCSQQKKSLNFIFSKKKYRSGHGMKSGWLASGWRGRCKEKSPTSVLGQSVSLWRSLRLQHRGKQKEEEEQEEEGTESAQGTSNFPRRGKKEGDRCFSTFLYSSSRSVHFVLLIEQKISWELSFIA